MGVLSGLIVSPCVTAPLAAALAFIAKTGDAVFGGATLFALSLGMGLPLVILAGGGGTLLPRAGAWMDGVKRFFGFLLLGVALW
ncbi:protein-disulfide reductase DsbD, partial [Pandoraea pneumonica]